MKSFKKILCVIEPEKNCKSALESAVTLAENNQTDLTVISMIEGIASSIEILKSEKIATDLQTMTTRMHKQEIESLVEPYRKKIKIQTKVLQGIPFLEIVREVLRYKYDLVVKTTETQDWSGRIFNSNDMHLLRKCPCPIWMIKPKTQMSYRRILAAVDVDDNWPPVEQGTRDMLNQRILEIAGSLALSEFAALHIVHAWEAAGESLIRGRTSFTNASDDEIAIYVEQVRIQLKKNLDILIHDVANSLGQDAMDYLKPQIHLIKGMARKEIPILAKKIETDLIVMGTVARTGIPGFIMGNTAETILNQINCSVLAIKPIGFITPITT
ncbi:MAG: universal stress protein [Nitrosomonas sp.]|uniref:universal stress protein n=1 Tax=Nitrosomonas sp. TaxID=42353 RepID=UPI0025E36F49|nr:universal stress protein [Nitrosomonas sp.]MBY0474400.1 universal stress protein [Nitrosomonas sp.]